MGEILSPFQGNFEPRSTLKWENVVFSENKEVLLFVPYSKTNGFEGKIIDLYPIKGSKFCPASSLIRLKKLAIVEGIWKPENPVFAFKSGKVILQTNSTLLLDILSEPLFQVFCHLNPKTVLLKLFRNGGVGPLTVIVSTLRVKGKDENSCSKKLSVVSCLNNK